MSLLLLLELYLSKWASCFLAMEGVDAGLHALL